MSDRPPHLRPFMLAITGLLISIAALITGGGASTGVSADPSPGRTSPLSQSVLVADVARVDRPIALEAPKVPKGPQVNPTATPGPHKIAFSGLYYTDYGTSDIFSMNQDGTNRTDLSNYQHLGNDTWPAWSPDGTQIAFSRVTFNGDPQQIMLMNADGSEQHAITNPPQHATMPTWSPDGSRIAFVSDGGGNGSPYKIYVMNSDGSGQTPITGGSGYDYWPAWSPDGTKIAFNLSNANGTNDQVYVMNPAGSGQIALTSIGSNQRPAWSPDSTKIVFASTRDDPNGSREQIYVMNANGTNQHNISNSPGMSDYTPSWSSQGIAFGRGDNRIWLMNADGTNQHQLSPPGNTIDDEAPAWGPASGPVVQVVDENQTPVPGAEVYRNNALLGRTNSHGVLSLPDAADGDILVGRSLVYTGTTNKGSHDGWAFHVWLTNVEQADDGSQNAYVITDTSKMTQTVTLKRDDAQIGLNIVGSVNYNATTANLESIQTGLQSASQYLFDVTDGQMYYENLAIYEDNENFSDADIQFSPSMWPSANAKGPAGLTGTTAHLYMPGPGFDGQQYIGGWEQPDAYRTFVHEFGHYAFGALDEYEKIVAGQQVRSTCTLDRNSVSEDLRASIMDSQYDATEMCNDDNHNNDTEQGQTLNESVWATFVRNWSDNNNRWTLRSPMTRGTVDPGPFNLLPMNQMDSTIVESPIVGCPNILTHIVVTIDGEESSVMAAPSFLEHSGREIYEGPTDSSGDVRIYGAVVSDTIRITSIFTGTNYSGSYRVASCDDEPTIELTPVHGPQSGPSKAPEAPAAMVATFTTDWLTSTLNYAQSRLDLALHFDGRTVSTPTLSISQDGSASQPIALAYNPSTFTYRGSYAVNLAHALNFSADVRIPAGTQTIAGSYRLVGARYSATGPAIGKGVQQTPLHPAVPTGWILFPEENMLTTSVTSSSLPDGTALVTGQTGLPSPPAGGTTAVGGPYFVQGDQPISGQMGLMLNYQAAYFCGLQSGSVSIYRYNGINGTGWTALPTTLNADWNQAYTALTQWGIYAVFARTNNPPTFTDVPPTNTFYNYISWIACHGIAGGYSNGTFRPGNNATRGQISKMVVLTFRWDQELPATNTFTDVPAGSTFYLYVEAAYRMGVFSGYPCGGSGEPCDRQHRPYFRPSANVTRGQITKILSNAARFINTPAGQTFTDVPPGSTFYPYVGRMAARGIIGGYPCGGPGEPCDSQRRPYFRPGSNATRGQLSKMIYLTVPSP